jgi:putative sterol carrier protein
MSKINVNDLMARLPRTFLPEAAKGVDVALQVRLTGNEASDWIITIRDQQCQIDEGLAENPRVTLYADSQDFIDIFSGGQNAIQAYMAGRLQLSGDLNLAMKVPGFFARRS